MMNQFESNVILNRFKTEMLQIYPQLSFESNVILNRFKTKLENDLGLKMFESNVILNRFKTVYCSISRYLIV